MRKWIVALGALLPVTLAAQAPGGDERLISRPDAHEGFVRKVADMACLDSGAGSFLCYKQVGAVILTVEAPEIDRATASRLRSLISSKCKGPAALTKPECLATVQFQVGPAQSQTIKTEDGPMKQVLIKSSALLLRAE